MTDRRHAFQLRRALATLTTLALVTPALAACDAFQDGIEVPIEVSSTLSLALDVGAATGPAAGQTAPEAVSYAVDLPPTRVDLLADSPELRKHRGKLRSIELVDVSVIPRASTLTAASPPLAVYLAATGATDLDDAVFIGTVPAIQPGPQGPVSVTLDADAQAAAQPFLLALDFTVLTAAAIDVEAGDTVPGGAATLDVAIDVRAVVDLLQ